MVKKKIALITGITGQDGSYLAEFLLEKNYKVVGLVRRSSQQTLGQAAHLRKEIDIASGDITDLPSLVMAVRTHKPTEIYNLAAQSHVGKSFEQPILTLEITGKGAVNVFEAVKIVGGKASRIYQASSSEMFGKPREIPQSETTPLEPANPYAVAKSYAHHMAKIYRDTTGMFIANGILFNHESPRRGINFVTQKVALGAACAQLHVKESVGLNENGQPIVADGKLKLGNLEAKRDWGYAKDYVEAMWLMLQQEKPDDFIIATGETHTIAELCSLAYSLVGLNYKDFVVSDQSLFRPKETGPLVGNASKAQEKLDWKPRTTFKELVQLMVDAELARLK